MEDSLSKLNEIFFKVYFLKGNSQSNSIFRDIWRKRSLRRDLINTFDDSIAQIQSRMHRSLYWLSRSIKSARSADHHLLATSASLLLLRSDLNDLGASICTLVGIRRTTLQSGALHPRDGRLLNLGGPWGSVALLVSSSIAVAVGLL